MKERWAGRYLGEVIGTLVLVLFRCAAVNGRHLWWQGLPNWLCWMLVAAAVPHPLLRSYL